MTYKQAMAEHWRKMLVGPGAVWPWTMNRVRERAVKADGWVELRAMNRIDSACEEPYG